MERLKIQDLQVGKVYRFYDNDDESLSESIYMIDEQGDLYWSESLFEENQNDFLKSALTYNEVKNNYFVEIKKKIDWTKVPRGTKVQVRNKEEGLWKNKYFVKFEAIDGYYPFITSIHLDNDFTNYKMEIDACEWQYCRIHPSVEILDEWYKEEE